MKDFSIGNLTDNSKAMNWVVTGARGNVGKALVNSLVERQENVFGLHYGPSQKITEINDSFVTLETDLTMLEDVQRVVKIVKDRKGEINVWINVVGGFAMGKSIEDMLPDDWSNMFNLNFQTALNCCVTILPHMKKAGFGRIINFGSVAAENGMAAAGPYTVSKAAVMALTKTIALEGKENGVTCNAIVPTIIDTLQNRAAMVDADFSSWTSPGTIAETIIDVVNSDQTGEMIHV